MRFIEYIRQQAALWMCSIGWHDMQKTRRSLRTYTCRRYHGYMHGGYCQARKEIW